MISGLRHSAAGMSQRMAVHEVLANNLANLGTAGFKADRLSFVQILKNAGHPPVREAAGETSAPRLFRTRTGPGDAVALTSIDLSPGPIQATGSDFDFAVEGTGFFVVQTPQGERYTRGGAFILDVGGKLVTRSGDPVLSDSGPIVVESGRLMVSEDGTISVNGEVQGKLRIVSFDRPSEIKKAGFGLYEAVRTPRSDFEGRILQGHLEDSNVNPVMALTEMMVALRQFEANQRALRDQAESVEKLIAEAGR